MVITHRQVDPRNDPLSQDFSPGVFELEQEPYKVGKKKNIRVGYRINYGPGLIVESAYKKDYKYLPDHATIPLQDLWQKEVPPQKMSFRFLFFDRPAYSRQVNVATSKGDKKFLADKGRLAHLSAKEFKKCFHANQFPCEPDQLRPLGLELVLLSIYVASDGSLQPEVAIRMRK